MAILKYRESSTSPWKKLWITLNHYASEVLTSSGKTVQQELDNPSNALTLEEIEASSDLSGKIASAQAARSLSNARFLDYEHKVLLHNSGDLYQTMYTPTKDGLLTATGYGSDSGSSYIYFTCGGVDFNAQSALDNNICNSLVCRAGEPVRIVMRLSMYNHGLYFIPFL